MFQQITSRTRGVVAVWSLDGPPDDRFGVLPSTLTDGAEVTELDSPPLPLGPLLIRSVPDVVVGGACSDSNYALTRVTHMWHLASDRVLG